MLPSAFILYVNQLELSSQFYADLLGIQPYEQAPTFTQFALTPKMGLGLKTKEYVQPPVETTGGGEIAFVVKTDAEVNDLFIAWQTKGIEMAQVPTQLSFGYSFAAYDPDHNRLRVVSLNIK